MMLLVKVRDLRPCCLGTFLVFHPGEPWHSRARSRAYV